MNPNQNSIMLLSKKYRGDLHVFPFADKGQEFIRFHLEIRHGIRLKKLQAGCIGIFYLCDCLLNLFSPDNVIRACLFHDPDTLYYQYKSFL
jgi:hypothetical protein